jgi:hypothetical protein
MPQRLDGKRARPAVGEPLQDAAEREREEDHHVEHGIDDAQARLGHGVVGGLLVRGERNGFGEHSRHRAAMRAHVADLAQREPQPRGAGRGERGDEDPGKSVAHGP